MAVVCPGYADIVGRMMSKDPVSRPSAHEALATLETLMDLCV